MSNEIEDEENEDRPRWTTEKQVLGLTTKGGYRGFSLEINEGHVFISFGAEAVVTGAGWFLADEEARGLRDFLADYVPDHPGEDAE